MKYFLPVLVLLLVINLPSIAQNNWSVKYEPQKVFIENKGQFDNLNNLPGSKVFFATENYANQVLFTKNGLTYRFEERVHPTKEEREEREKEMKEDMKKGRQITHQEMEQEEHRFFIRRDFVQMNWVNANPNVEIVSSGEVSNYFNYGNISGVKGFKKITYKNLYPNIDAEYVFHSDNGIEYSFILHPGADASLIKMTYSDVSGIKSDTKGNLLYPTLFGNIVEHTPKTFYSANHAEVISSKFIRTGKTVSFELGSYDRTREVIIDPWVQSPQFNTQWDCIWECERDGSGNAYIIGGVMNMQLLKYNPAGTLQWTYNTPYDTTSWLGTFAVDNAGNSYVTQGSLAAIQKVNTGGTLVWDNPNPGGIFSSTEFWSISFNCDETRLVIGGTGDFLPPRPYIYQVDMNSGNVTSSVRVTGGALFPTQEVRSIVACGNGKYYFLTHDSIGYLNQNFSVCANSSQAVSYRTNSKSLGYKCENFRYNNTGIPAIESYGGFIYTNTGNQLNKRDFATGAILSSVTIPSGAYTTSFGSSFVENSGIAVDNCGNIYVGSKGQVVKFDQNLTQLATYPVPNVSGQQLIVYDVEVSTNGDIIAAGSTGTANSGARYSAVHSIAASACSPVAITCCDASICRVGPFCTTNGPVTLTPSTPGGTWSGPGITNSVTGVFSPSVAGQGTHYIKNTIGCGSDSIAITVNICAALSACLEQNGNITVSNGTPTYTWYEQDTTQNCSSCVLGCIFPPGCATTSYVWQQFGTGATVSPPEFPVRVTDANSNELVIANTGSLPACQACALTASASSTNTSCGSNNGSATATASGGTPTGYLWSNGGTTATISNLAAGTYTVTVSGSGCTATASAVVSTSNGVSLTPSSTNASCGVNNGSASVAASGGNGSFTYLWSNGGTSSGISGVAAGTYTVTVSSSGCTATASITVTATNAVTASASSTNAGCAPTGSATANASGGNGSFTYLWSNGGTSATISNIAPGTYTVTVSSAGCSATASAVVTSNGSVTATTSVTNAGCSPTGSATANPGGGTGSFVYLWSNGGTTATISNLSGGTYIVTITSGTCSVTASAVVGSSGGVSLTPSSTPTTCGVSNGAASVTPTGANPFSYLWSNGGTGPSITNLAAGTYSVTVGDNNGCSATLSIIVNSSTVDSVQIAANKNIMCSGDSARICATSGYSAYQWNTGSTDSCIYTKLAGNYYLTATDANNCTTSSNRVSIGVYPLPPVSISVNGDTLTGYNAVTYQWYLNSSPIPGATSNIYIATQTGDYTLAVTDSNGCRSVSTKVTVNVTGIEDLLKDEKVEIYPNPLESGNWTLEVGSGFVGSEAEIFDNNGRLVYKSEIRNQKSQLELNVAGGIYFLRVNSNQVSVTRKLIKL